MLQPFSFSFSFSPSAFISLAIRSLILASSRITLTRLPIRFHLDSNQRRISAGELNRASRRIFLTSRGEAERLREGDIPREMSGRRSRCSRAQANERADTHRSLEEHKGKHTLSRVQAKCPATAAGGLDRDSTTRNETALDGGRRGEHISTSFFLFFFHT